MAKTANGNAIRPTLGLGKHCQWATVRLPREELPRLAPLLDRKKVAAWEGTDGATMGTSIELWAACAILAAGIGWSRYDKKKTRDKLLRELLAMEPERREKLLTRLRPELQIELRQQLMERFRSS